MFKRERRLKFLSLRLYKRKLHFVLCVTLLEKVTEKEVAVSALLQEVQAKVLRLPVRYFDSTQTGVLVSRIMSDAEGIRNLVGTGLVQLVGSVLTALVAIGVLFWINWKLTAVNLVTLLTFGAVERLDHRRISAGLARAESRVHLARLVGVVLSALRAGFRRFSAEWRKCSLYPPQLH